MERGLLDWPGVVFGLVNQPLVAVLPEPVVLAFWALVSSWLTMWVYRRFSNQEKMAALKPQINDFSRTSHACLTQPERTSEAWNAHPFISFVGPS